MSWITYYISRDVFVFALSTFILTYQMLLQHDLPSLHQILLRNSKERGRWIDNSGFNAKRPQKKTKERQRKNPSNTGCITLHLSFRTPLNYQLVTANWLPQLTARALASDWSEISFVIFVREKIVLVTIWTENSDWTFKKFSNGQIL